jgi:hypothetical protein
MLSVFLFIGTFISAVILSFRNSAVFVFVLYQAYYFFNPRTKWWGDYIPDLRFSFYIVLTLLIIVAFKWRSLSANKILAIPQFWFLYLTVALYFIAYFYAVLPLEHMIAMDAILTAAVIITLAFKLVTKEEHLDYIIWGYITFAAYVGYYVSQVGRVSAGRFDGGAGMVDSPDSNGIASALAPALVFTLYYFWQKPSLLTKAPFIVAGYFLANALVILGSRGAFLGVAIGASVFLTLLFFSKMQRKNQRLGVIGILIFGLIGVAVVTDRVFWQRMSTITEAAKLENMEEEESGGTRVLFWKAAINMAEDHPFGAGSSGFVYYSSFYIPENVNTGRSRNRAVHSTWFEVLTEIGYLGFLTFFGMIYYSFITCYRASRRLKHLKDAERYFKVIAINCALLCFVVSMTFLNRLRAEILYWCILYTAVAYNFYVLKPRNNNEVSKFTSSQ